MQRVACFADKKNRLDCPLLLCQEQGYAEAWAVVTDLPPQQVHGAWYRLRAWIEGGFKDYKGGQWGWQHTKMLDPQRAERLWLALAVSTLWVVGVGSQAEVTLPAKQPEQLPPRHVARTTAGSGTKGPRGRDTPLCDPRSAVLACLRLARGGVAASGVVARAVAAAVSCRAQAVAGKGAQATETAGTTTGETAQAQGGPPCGQGQREKGGLKNLPEGVS